MSRPYVSNLGPEFSETVPCLARLPSQSAGYVYNTINTVYEVELVQKKVLKTGKIPFFFLFFLNPAFFYLSICL